MNTNSSKALRKFNNRDRMVCVLTENSEFRVVAVKADEIVRTAMENHSLNPLQTLILGELMTAALLCSGLLQGAERISLHIESESYVSSAWAEANALGEVRGYIFVRDELLSALDQTRPLWNSIADGVLHVKKILYDDAAPASGVVAMQNSSISMTMAHYFAQSEQTPTAFQISAHLNKSPNAAGLLIQALPGASEKSIVAIETNIIDNPSIAKILSDGDYLDGILDKFLFGFKWQETSRIPVDFFCRCTKAGFLGKLKILGKEEIEEMVSIGNQELQCQYCGKKYQISVDELRNL